MLSTWNYFWNHPVQIQTESIRWINYKNNILNITPYIENTINRKTTPTILHHQHGATIKRGDGTETDKNTKTTSSPPYTNTSSQLRPEEVGERFADANLHQTCSEWLHHNKTFERTGLESARVISVRHRQSPTYFRLKPSMCFWWWCRDAVVSHLPDF